MQVSNLVMPKVVVDIWRRIGAVCPFYFSMMLGMKFGSNNLIFHFPNSLLSDIIFSVLESLQIKISGQKRRQIYESSI